MKMCGDSSGEIDEAISCLREGGIVAHATETCYGLACDLSNPDAVTRLFRIKKRTPEFPVSALFATVDDAKQYVEWNDVAEDLAEKFLPGPLTIILPMREDAPRKIFPCPMSHVPCPISLGIRVSSHPVAMELATRFGFPISTTSANIGGEKEAYSPSEILDIFASQSEKPDLLIDSGLLRPTPPSTIVRINKGKTDVIRRGPLIF